VAHFWDQGWLDGFGYQILDVYGLAFPESQYDRRADAYKGNIPFNGDDSPYRPQLEFFKEAYDKGWLPENFWTRQWESDMEAGFVAKQTVLLEHGPWVWDKAKAADPSVELLGFPHTPPAAGQDSWLNYQFPPAVNGTAAWAIRAQNETGPNWEAVKKLYFWWFSPEIVKLRAEAEGVAVNYNLDEPLNLTSPMFVGLLKDISTPGGKWEHVKFEYRDPVEEFSGFREAGSPGVWDFESGNIAKTWADLLTGKITVQDVLDQCQKNWEISYPKLVAGELQG
jgi:ABC-type glycerol-3-phosphate transport system substrate-binding protein